MTKTSKKQKKQMLNNPKGHIFLYSMLYVGLTPNGAVLKKTKKGKI